MKNLNYFKEKDKPHKTIISVDLKSFYASVECVDRNLDPFVTPLIVADRSRGKGTIALAVSPYLKAMGIPNRLRIFDLPNIPNIIFATPRMSRYLEVSAKVHKIFLKFALPEDIHIYSIDESFIDITNYAEVKRKGAKSYAKKIMDEIYKELKLQVTIGIGENIFMAKCAMDIEAKKSEDYMAEWTYDDIPSKLWPISPLSKMWGIGKNLEKKLNALGFHHVGDIATSDLDYLKNKFGIIGEEIYNHSHGIDYADLHEVYKSMNTSISVGQTLFENYDYKDVIHPIIEMCEEIMVRLVNMNKLCKKIYLSLGFPNHSGHVTGHYEFLQPTNDETEIKNAVKEIYNRKLVSSKKIRRINICASDLYGTENYQLDLFTDIETIDKKKRLTKTIVGIKNKYGSDKITKATSAYKKSNFEKRHSEIGGHKK